MFCKTPGSGISATTVQGPKVGIHPSGHWLLQNRDLVPEENLLAGEAVAIRCAHGDTVLYPLAQIQLEVEQQVVNTIAAVADRHVTWDRHTSAIKVTQWGTAKDTTGK